MLSTLKNVLISLLVTALLMQAMVEAAPASQPEVVDLAKRDTDVGPSFFHAPFKLFRRKKGGRPGKGRGKPRNRQPAKIKISINTPPWAKAVLWTVRAAVNPNPGQHTNMDFPKLTVQNFTMPDNSNFKPITRPDRTQPITNLPVMPPSNGTFPNNRTIDNGIPSNGTLTVPPVNNGTVLKF